jgi:hypothetical protein
MEVEGSSPFSRFEEPPAATAFPCLPALHAPGWEAFLLAGCQLVAKTPRPESSAKASSSVHPMSFSSVSRPPSPMSMTCW